MAILDTITSILRDQHTNITVAEVSLVTVCSCSPWTLGWVKDEVSLTFTAALSETKKG